MNVEVAGYLGGVQVYDRNFVVDATGPTFVTFEMPGVDRVAFTPSGGVQHSGYGNGAGAVLVMDDLVVGPAAVPEPMSLALPALGLACGVGWRCRLASRKSDTQDTDDACASV